MTLPTGERLLITIDRKVEVECDYKVDAVVSDPPMEPGDSGHVWDVVNACVGGILDDGCQRLGKCPQCHGTGRVTKRVRGWVQVKTYSKLSMLPDSDEANEDGYE